MWRRLTEHIANVDNDWTGLSWQRSEGVADRVIGVALATGTDFETILTISLEQQGKASNVGMVASSPSSCCVFGGHVVNQSHLGEVVWRFNVHGSVEVILFEAKRDRETGD